MSVRTRKLIGSMAIIAFLGAYIAVVATLAEGVMRNGNWLVQLVFFVVSGVSWGIPLIPLISWMNRSPR
jgi:hypothetical protein